MRKSDYPKMHAGWKAWWIKTLRSGNFTQGRGMLRDRFDESCCLGVLAEGLRRKHPKTFQWVCGLEYYEFDAGQYENSDAGLGLQALKTCGLSDDAQVQLMELNDRRRWTFGEIANWIEANL